ncbi:MAG: hypothetical protein RIS29_2088 [Bacteroidota bacterium]|jgi:PST family polysaccharide transporter
MLDKIHNKIKPKLQNNLKVVENYFFMTALQIINSAFGILIYPFLIRILGASSYGVYVFALSITSYFTSFISFGFNMPASREIVENKSNRLANSKTLSSVLTAKLFLSAISIIVFTILMITIPIFRNNRLIFIICFTQILYEALLPVWYFQGIQKMKVITYIQLAFKVLSLPFIFLLIKHPADCYIYVIIMSLSLILGAITTNIVIIYKYKTPIRLVSPSHLKKYFTDSLPFFWSNSTSTIKLESVTILIGSFMGMKEVAYYDLANKLIIIPRMLTTNINAALFPKIMENPNNQTIRKILKTETYLGLSVIACIAAFGYWAVLLLGGKDMIQAYPLSIILSVTVLTWLLIGCYINFIFIPANKYYLATKNQIVAFCSFFILALPSAILWGSIYSIVIALSLSGLAEIIYCNFVTKKMNLL